MGPAISLPVPTETTRQLFIRGAADRHEPMSNIAFKSTEDQKTVERFLSPGLWIDPVTVLLQPDIVSQELFMSALVKVALKVPALKVWFTSKRYYL